MRYRPFGASGAAISNLTLSFGPGCLARGREAALDLLYSALEAGIGAFPRRLVVAPEYRLAAETVLIDADEFFDD